jgi:hypothetical protein
MLDMGCASSSGTRPPSSGPSLSAQDIATLRRILATSGSSSSIGTAGFVTAVSRTKRPPSPQSGSSHPASGWSWPSAP